MNDRPFQVLLADLAKAADEHPVVAELIEQLAHSMLESEMIEAVNQVETYLAVKCFRGG